MLNVLTKGPDLIALFDQISQLLDSINSHLESIDSKSAYSTENETDQTVCISLASDGRLNWSDNRQMILKKVIFGASNAGRYSMNFGTDTNYLFRMGANSTATILDEPIILPRGQVIGFTAPGGTWEANLFFVPGEVAGSVNVRQ